MTRCTGIIAEYNPFHNGHRFHIERTKAQNGGRPVIVAMSGWFVQRGDVAAYDPYIRAKWALENGADIVLMLPVMFSMAQAERFAVGGVSLLNSTRIVDSLSFGAECGDAAILSRLANSLKSESTEYKAALASALSSGKSFPAARSAALCATLGEENARLLSCANNILGIEYINAIAKLNAPIVPMAVMRTGAQHDSAKTENGSMSASAIRTALLGGNAGAIRHAVPQSVYSAVADLSVMNIESLSQAAIYALRRLSPSDIAALPDVAEGLENAICSACRESSGFAELTMSIKSKRYTLSRIRRICINALLGITKSDYARHLLPEYIRVLGARREALPLMGEMAKKASLPLVACRADYDKLSESAKAAFDKDIFAAETAQLNGKAISEFKRKFIIV